MLPLDRSRRAPQVNPLEGAVRAYHEATLGPARLSLERVWSDLAPGKTTSILAGLVKVDLQRRFDLGERPKVLEYLERFPELASNGDRVVSLVYEEFCLLEESGEDPDSLEFCRDYDPWRDSLASQLAYHRELSRAVGAETPRVKFPELGERFDKYRLNSILGVGGIARVYRATEEDLGDRQIAIKVSASFGQEPSILANLDHRNIVPILTVAESPCGLRGICMPYRPGSTLETLMSRLGRGTPPRSARAIVEALEQDRSESEKLTEEQRAGWVGFPSGRTFPEAVAWIGLALSNALAYLHDRGIFHRDIKPANVLLAHREGPQLLDFNLAQIPNSHQVASAAQKGGTLPYMAPEQLKAFLDPSAWGGVKESADLYSLGLVLRELLTGQAPERPSMLGSLPRVIQSLIDRRAMPMESIREINPGVPPALDSILEKCLAFDPAHRYLSAADLADDLRRFLERRPLRNAPNPSRLELALNWTIRNRHGLVALFLLSVILLSPLNSSNWGKKVGREAYVQAEAYLDSGNPGDLERAKTAFERLRREQPESARSSLGLAMTLLKLPKPDQKVVNDLMNEVRTKPDAAEVLRERLAKQPPTTMLLINLGLVVLKEGQVDEARKLFNLAADHDPLSIPVLVALAKLEIGELHYDQALEYLEKVIKLGRGRISEEIIYPYRHTILNLSLQKIDKELAGTPSEGRNSQVSTDLRRLETNLIAFSSDWDNLVEAVGRDIHLPFVRFYEGCILSIRGVLAADSGDPGRSRNLLEEAGMKFEQAKKLATGTNSNRSGLLQQVMEQESRRRSRLAALAPGG